MPAVDMAVGVSVMISSEKSMETCLQYTAVGVSVISSERRTSKWLYTALPGTQPLADFALHS